MSSTISVSEHEKAENQAKKAISSDGLVIYPTDTLYGIGCNAISEKAVDKLCKVKKRERNKPLSILVADYPMVLGYCKISSEQEKILHSLLPGPYTFILPLKKKLPVSPTMSIGVRIPEHMFMRQVSKELNLPIVSTSANFSGSMPPTKLSEVDKQVLEKSDLAIDSGKCIYCQPSTVIDLIAMKILRKGATRPGDKFEWEK